MFHLSPLPRPTSLDESDDDTEILAVVALLVHDQGNHVQQYRDSVKGHGPVRDRNREAVHEQLWQGIFSSDQSIV
jgi:hypothetical protein